MKLYLTWQYQQISPTVVQSMNHAEYSTESHCKVMRLMFCTYNFTNKLYVQLAIYTVHVQCLTCQNWWQRL